MRRKPPSHKYQRGLLNQRYGSSLGLYDRTAFYPAPLSAGRRDISRYVQSSRGGWPLSSKTMKSATFDLVATGDERAAIAAAMDAVRRGQRVLVVLRSGNSRAVSRVRCLCRGAVDQLTVMTNAEVVCVDGIDGVEAVVIRRTRTGHLSAVNASAFLVCEDGSSNVACAGGLP